MAHMRLKFIFEHGPAEETQLDLYDGALSLGGIARATAIATHAFLNGEIRIHGDTARGARLYLLPSRPGSFIFEVGIWMLKAVSEGVFYDFIKYAFDEAVGRSSAEEISGPLQPRIEPTIGELPAVLESPLRHLHRPIHKHPDMTLTVIDPRGRALITFDHTSAEALEPRYVHLTEPLIGNVTRYNTLSGWGNLYDRTQKRVISFVLDANVSERERSLITWSLQERNIGREGTLRFQASAFTTPGGHIKRYDIHRVFNEKAQ
jgi:hypothetical protein